VLEFLFKYPPTVFRKGDFVFSSGWPVWLLALLVIAAGAGLWWHVQRHHGRLEGRRPWTIWALEFAAVALILFYVITQPSQAAEAVQGILGWLRDGAEAIITFMKNLFA